jgi:DNA-binding NarL/FixJ family response regulator
MKPQRELTVLVIDEHPEVSQMLARGLRRIPGLRVIGETSNVMLGAEIAHQLEPGVILADFRRTGPPRAETYRWLARVSPSSKLVAHTSYITDGEERALSSAGVARCILKGSSVRRLAEELIELARSNGRSSTVASNREET